MVSCTAGPERVVRSSLVDLATEVLQLKPITQVLKNVTSSAIRFMRIIQDEAPGSRSLDNLDKALLP